MLDMLLSYYSLWTCVLFLACLHCPFLQRTGRVAWNVAGALCALVQVTLQHQLSRLRCSYYKFTHTPVECAADPKNKPAPNVVMRRPGGEKCQRFTTDNVKCEDVTGAVQQVAADE